MNIPNPFGRKEDQSYEPFEDEDQKEEQKTQGGTGLFGKVGQMGKDAIQTGADAVRSVGNQAPYLQPAPIQKIKEGLNSSVDQSRGLINISAQQLGSRNLEVNAEGEEGEEEEGEEGEGEEGEGEGEEEEEYYDSEEEEDAYGNEEEEEYEDDEYQGDEEEEEEYEEDQFQVGGGETDSQLELEQVLLPVQAAVEKLPILKGQEVYKQGEIELVSVSNLDKSKSQKSRVLDQPKAGASEKEAKFVLDVKLDKEGETKKYLQQQERVRQAVKQRKIVRFIAYFIYLIIILVLIVVACKFLMIRNDFVAGSNTNFNITIDNCTLFITDKTDNTLRSPVYIKYQVPTQLQPDSPTTVNLDKTSDPVNLEVLNGINPRYCLIQMFVQPGTALGSVTINCAHCNITQDTSTQLQVGDLDISGDVIYANFRNIKASSFNYDAFTGFLQLNNIETVGTSTISVVEQGDIIIQSIKNFRLNGESDTQAFCLSGPALKEISATDCIFSGDNTTVLAANATCNIVYDICTASNCAKPDTTFVVKSSTGNIYANVIPAVGMPININDTKTVMGRPYDDGIGFDPESEAAISGFDSLVADQSKGNPFILFDLGNFQSRSSKSTRWVVSSTPSYSYIKPWWIGTFSASVLNGYVERTNGFLLPGFCPFIPEFTNDQLLEVEELIDSKITTQNVLVTFVQDDSMPQPPVDPIPSTGVLAPVPTGDPNDKWYSVSLAPNGKIVIENNDYTKKGTILAAVIVSLVIAIYVSYLALSITFVGINNTYTQLKDFANHLDSYAKLERSQNNQPIEPPKDGKDKPKEPTVLDAGSNFLNILRNAPSPSAFIDYLSLILYRRYSSSVAQFYNLLFSVADAKALRNQKLDPTKNMIKGTDVKVLYEKFCFMNHLTEELLTDQQNLDILESYGFEVTKLEDQKIEVFTKLDIKNYDPFLVTSDDQESVTSLELYMRENVTVTQFAEDQIEVSLFISKYREFCDYNRLPPVSINPALMKDKFSVDIDLVPQQTIMRIQTDSTGALAPISKKNEAEKPFYKRWFQRETPSKVYVIDKSKLENHFNLVMNVKMNSKRTELATVDLILYPGWQFWDALTVLFHLLIGGFVTIPIICFVILNESQYEPWSLQNPLYLLRFEDVIHDPAQLLYNLYHTFSWNIGLMVLVTALWVISFFDLLWYYAVMDFPQDKSFKRSEDQADEGFWKKRNRQVEWLLVLASLALYFGYIGLLLTWLLLGAFINPNAFLPFASAAATFITFVVAKYNSFKTLFSQGTKAVQAYVQQLFGGFINGVLGKIVTSIEKAVPVLSSGNLKQVVGSEGFKNVTDKLGEMGVLDPNTLDEYTEKIQSFDPQNIIATSTAGGAPSATTQQELATQKAASKELATIMKTKTIEKIKSECAKRGIPGPFADLMIAVSMRDVTQIRNLSKQIIEESNQKLGLVPESAEVISELLFPQGLTPDETIMFITTKSMKLIFQVCRLENVPGLTPEGLVKIFHAFRNMEEQKYDAFVRDMTSLFSSDKNPSVGQIKLILPILLCISTLVNEKEDTWNAKDACLQLLNASTNLLQTDKDKKDGGEIIKGFINFLPVLFANKEMSTDFESKEKETLDSYGVTRVINNFCKSVGLKLSKSDDGGIKFIPSFLQACLNFTKQNVYDIPRDVLKVFEREFQASIPNTSDFLAFWLKIIHFNFKKPRACHTDFNKCISCFDLSLDLKNFLRIITCYSLDDYDKIYGTIPVEKNFYFIKLAENLKVEPKQLLGLIDLIYQKNSSKNITVFLNAMLERMKINLENTRIIRALVELFLSEDEVTLLNSLKTLNLESGLFLLVGKGCLDARAIPASQFQSAGVYNKELVDKRSTMAAATEEAWLAWKTDIKKSIGETLMRTKKSLNMDDQIETRSKKISQEEELLMKAKQEAAQEAFKKVEAKANLVRLFLSDWDAFTYSKKNVTSAINNLDNAENQLKSKLLENQGGSFTVADLLPILMNVKDLKLTNKGRYDQFTKEKEAAITSYAEHLGINGDTLRKVIQLFVLSDQKVILKQFFEFFPDEKENEQEIKKIVSYGFKQVSSIQRQLEFVKEQFPKSISLPYQTGPLFPAKFFEKMFLSDYSKARFGLGSLFDVILMQTANYNLPANVQETLFTECCRFAMFAKGSLPRGAVQYHLGIKNDVILDIFDILTENSTDKRMASFTKLFLSRENPIKAAIAFYGLLINRKFNVIHHPTISGEADEEPIKPYLSELFNIEPELFDLFELAYEKDPAKFLTSSLPLMRRLSGSSFVNTPLMESLFLLSFGEHFNSNYIASRLGISSNIIEFFVFLIRLSKKSSRRKELQDLPQLLPVTQILQNKLKIKTTELISLVKLIFSMFDSDESLVNIITDLKLKSKDAQAGARNEINIDVFKGFATLNKPVDPKVDIFKNKKVLSNLKEKINPLFESLGLTQFKSNAFILANLAAGNFLVLKEYKQDLSWFIPTHDPRSEMALLHLTMALSALLNASIEVDDGLDKSVKDQIAKYAPYNFEEVIYKAGDKGLPTNSMAYAVCLTYQTLNISPIWTQAFLMDQKAFIDIQTVYPDLKSEFLWCTVLQFINKIDTLGDMVGLYEWVGASVDFYKTRTGKEVSRCAATDFRKKISRIDEHLADVMDFNFYNMKDLAQASSLLQTDLWQPFFTSRKKYNSLVNQSLLYLLTFDQEKSVQDGYFSKVKNDTINDPYEFLGGLLVHLPKDDGDDDLGYRAKVGKLIRKALIQCYKITSEKFHKNDYDYSTYALTDLCSLGTLSFLRQDTTISKERKLYNLHQLASNIERKMCFRDEYLKMSKFKLMKLIGVPLNLEINNLNEWNLPASIFSNEYVDEVELADTDEEIGQAKEKWCNTFVLKRKEPENKDENQDPEENKEQNEEDDEDDEEYDYEVDLPVICDMGVLYANFEDAIKNIDQCLDAKGWDDINLEFGLDEYYLCDYTQENIDRLCSMIDHNSNYWNQVTDDPRIFLPLEVVQVLYDEYGSYRDLLSQKRKRYGKGTDVVGEETDFTADDTVVDTRTGLSYKELVAKALEFEKTLLDPNTELILGIIRGDDSAFSKSEHALAKGDPEGKRSKVYRALTGLQSFRSKKQKQSLPLKEYLGILAGQLDSNMTCLEEILAFITGKPIVSEITSILEIDDATADFLLINVKEKVSTKDDEEEDQDTEEKVSIIDIISKKINMTTKELEIFDIIRNIYLFRKQPGWMDALRLLAGEKRYKAQKELLKSNTTQKQGVPLPKHPLAKLFKMINFGSLKRQAATPGEDKVILNAIQGKNEEEQMEKIFDYILGQEIYKFTDQQKTTLKQQHSAIRLLLKLNFREAFKQLVLSVPQKDASVYAVQLNAPQNILGSILELFGVKATTPEIRREIKYLKIFLLLIQDDLKALQSRGNSNQSNVTPESIIEDMVQLDFLTSLKGDRQKQKRICQILLSTLAWDSRLVLDSFAQEDTLKEGYLLYNIYTCFNISKLHDQKADLKWNFLALLTSSIGNLVTKAAATSLKENKDNVEVLNEYQMKENTQSAEELQEKITALFNSIKNSESLPLVSFLYNAEIPEDDSEKGLKKYKLVQTLTSTVVSFSDFTFFKRLLNSFIDPSSKKDMHDRLKLLYDLIIKIEDFYTYGSFPYVNDDFRSLVEAAEKEPSVPGQIGPLRALLSLIPDIMFIYLRFQSDVDYTDQIKLDIVKSIKDIMDKMPDKIQKDFISDMVSVLLGTNINTLPGEDVKNPKLKIDYGIDRRKEILFNRFRTTFFPSIDEKEAFETWFTQSYNLVKKLKNDFMTSLKDAQKRRGAARNVLKIFEDFKLCHHNVMDALFAMQDGDLVKFESKLTPIAPTLGIPADSLPQMVSYMKEAQNLLRGDFFTKQNQLAQPPVVKPKTDVNSEDWVAMVKKIKEGTASSKDLFNMVDAAGDKSGSISESEFLTLAGRLGLKLSSHRVKEIFAKVKGSKADVNNQDLNVDEFDKALGYLQEKNLQQALLLLGITPEILAGVLIRLTILLLLLFVFIFLGIKAFAVGGTFGSIINSLFPMAGGGALGKESESDKSKLEDTNVKEAADTGFAITTSEQL